VRAQDTWRDDLGELDERDRSLLLGGTLSRRFSGLPLWLNHPANIGGFYGILVSLALILPYCFTVDSWLMPWVFHSALLIASCIFLGMVSRLINVFTKRMPMNTPRGILYAMPFLGLMLLTIDMTTLFDIPNFLVWGILMIPGPLYVHITWAPRWRMLCMLDYDENPFSGHIMPSVIADEETKASGNDSVMREVIEELSPEEQE
jgi:hypothetical protein